MFFLQHPRESPAGRWRLGLLSLCAWKVGFGATGWETAHKLRSERDVAAREERREVRVPLCVRARAAGSAALKMRAGTSRKCPTESVLNETASNCLDDVNTRELARAVFRSSEQNECTCSLKAAEQK